MTKKLPDFEQFEACQDAALTIIPLRGKRPLDDNWTERDYRPEETLARIKRDKLNAGMRIPVTVFVFDVDAIDSKGNRGLESYEALCWDIGFDDSDFHRVRTGSGGKHVIGTIPPGFKTITTLRQYGGVQTRRKGNQIVLSGSVHPDTGELYRFEDDSPDWSAPLRPFPKCVLDLIAAPEKSERETLEGGTHTPEQVSAMLDTLDPTNYDYNEWLHIGMAAKHAGGDEVKEVFLDWSQRDPRYANKRDENEMKWDSFDGEGISYRTLEWHVNQADPATLAQIDFADAPPIQWNPPKDEPGESFRRYAQGTKKGKIVTDSQDNIRLALRQLGVNVSYNLFSDKIVIAGLKCFGPHLDDAAMERLWLTVDAKFHFRPTLLYFETVVRDAARRNSFHPVREYLDTVQRKWDGKPRIDTWLRDYAGAKDSPYIRAVSALPLIAAVRRVRQPGCKYDEMVILESSQGKDKSTALEMLAVEKDWFSDSLPLNADGKQVIEAIAGKWIIECADLHGLSRANVDSVKAMLSRTVDRARMSYGRNPIERPRQNVIFGTANSQDYLRDKTGNRRFWPVAVKVFDVAWLKRDRDQLWAEAATREAKGESIRLDRELWAAAGEEQERRIDAASDPYTDELRNVLGNMDGKLSSSDVWSILGLKTAGQRTQDQNDRMGKAMRYLGWKRKAVKIGGDKKNGYVRGPQPFRQIIVSRSGDDISAYYDEELDTE